MTVSTTTYGFPKPTVGGDADAWGGELNSGLDLIDSTISTANLTLTHVSSSLSNVNSSLGNVSSSLSQVSSSLSTTTSTATANTANISSGSTSLSQISSSLSNTTTSLANVSTSLGSALSGTNANTIGYLGIPITTKSGNYTNVLGDMGKEFFYTASATQTIDSNANVAAQIGSFMVFSVDAGFTLTVSITTDTLRWLTGNVTGTRTVTGPGQIIVSKKKTAEWWAIGGSGIS